MAELSKVLTEGVRILEPVFKPYGFKFKKGPSGRGSGGSFVSGAFVMRDRKFEFHVRYSVGLVSYQLGDAILSHEDYMRQLNAKNRYPSFNEEFSGQFQALAYDVATFALDFLSGDGKDFKALASDMQAHPNKFKGLPG
jgi:hypothetical protein